MNKNEIKKLLKAKGLVKAPWNNGYGFRGGEYGPLTVTNTYLERNDITIAQFTWKQIQKYSANSGMDSSYSTFYYILNWKE